MTLGSTIKDPSEAANDHAGLHEAALQEKPREMAIAKVHKTNYEMAHKSQYQEKQAHAR